VIGGRRANGDCDRLIILGEFASAVAAFADYYWAGQSSCNQERFVAEVARGAIWIDAHIAAGFAAVSAREHVKRDAVLLEEFAEHNHEGRLA
jgi:hypothetical protein